MPYSQMLEVGTEPELKEGFYIGEDLPVTHPYFLQKKLNSGLKIWPESLEETDYFKKKQTTSEYYKEVCKLAKDVLIVLALSLDLAENYFNSFVLVQLPRCVYSTILLSQLSSA
jgi:isopenicillin N synthase-like dioxygenase